MKISKYRYKRCPPISTETYFRHQHQYQHRYTHRSIINTCQHRLAIAPHGTTRLALNRTELKTQTKTRYQSQRQTTMPTRRQCQYQHIYTSTQHKYRMEIYFKHYYCTSSHGASCACPTKPSGRENAQKQKSIHMIKSHFSVNDHTKKQYRPHYPSNVNVCMD